MGLLLPCNVIVYEASATSSVVSALDPQTMAAIVGHNPIRAHWLALAATQDQVEFTIERHLVSGDTIVAIWHLSYVLREDGGRRRASGVLVLDTTNGAIERLREWSHERRADTAGGEPAAE
jgi:ketosteroid isomerase-like protein